jgi:hypothetical protein
LAALAARPAAAHADDAKARCVRAHVDGQRQRLAGDLEQARESLRACLRPGCPDLVRRDCVTWLREVQALIPTVIFGAQDERGGDLADVRVFVDGALVQQRLAGEPVELRPGKRAVRFESEGQEPAEMQLVVAQGEKNRLVRATLKDPPAPEGSAAVRALPFALGGFGLAAATAGLVLDLVATAELRELRDTCAPFCSTDDVNATRNMMIAGDTLLAVGILSIGAAVIWLVLREPADAKAAARPGVIVW